MGSVSGTKTVQVHLAHSYSETCGDNTADQQTRVIDTMLALWWPTVYYTGPTLSQHWHTSI